MRKPLLNRNNITQVEFQSMMTFVSDMVGGTAVGTQQSVQHFSDAYIHVIELWGCMLHEHRRMKMSSKNKDAVQAAMDKRDYLEKIASAVKIKFMASSQLYKSNRSKYGIG